MSTLSEDIVLAPASSRQRETGRTATRLTALWHDIKIPLRVFLLVRVFLSVAVYFLSPLLPVSSYGIPSSPLPDQPLLDSMVRWDSSWYASIALDGYRFAADLPSNIAFLPAYPLAIKGLSLITGNVWISGILIANAAFLGSLIFLFKLTQLKFGREAAARAVLYTSVFPAAFFFYSMYSESLYLLSVLLAFYLWERNKDWSAGLFGAIAALARPMGILVFLAGAAGKLLEGRNSPVRPSWDSLWLLLIPLGFGSFLAYSYASFGEPFAFLKSREVGWNEPVSLIPITVRELFDAIAAGTVFTGGVQKLRLLDAASGITFLALAVPVFRKLGPSYGVYSLGSVIMPLVVCLDGLTRYVAVIFPVFMILGVFPARKYVVLALGGLSVLLMVLMASMFSRWYFVG